MIEPIYKNIYRIGVPLTGNPLKELNSYFIRGTDSDLLIDTGFRRKDCESALREALSQLGSDPARRDVYITHLHSDHSGMADLFVGEGRRIYISDIDYQCSVRWREMDFIERDKRFLKEGFTLEMLEYLALNSPTNIDIMKDWRLPCFHTLKDGDVIDVGDHHFKVIVTPGHTPGNTMLWEASEGIMFTGDNILFDITPNITFWDVMPDALGSYLESLKRSYDYPVRYAFPGHRKTGNYHERIEKLLVHHERRIAEAHKVVCEYPGLTAAEIAGKMTWRIHASSWEEFPIVQKRFAVGECLSHLDYLRLRGKVQAAEDAEGVRHYEAMETEDRDPGKEDQFVKEIR